ncbi:hypothetical protein PWT90_06572 [Aphanocladium album]|nr:hypothetical protein PWT90_06572 [Aphanocladium album]
MTQVNISAMPWEEAAAQKRAAVNDLIPSAWRISRVPPVEEQPNIAGDYIRQFLTAHEVEITETEATAILAKTTSGTWTAKEVTAAFCHRAALGHQLVNCLHEIFFDAAMADAEKLDDYFAKHGKPVGPLHGLPVSLKDQFHVKGVETTMGYVGWIGTFQGKVGTGKEKVFESELVRELRNLGAVLFCKTALAQAVFTFIPENNICGYTRNPLNRRLGPGGSSGGEAALVALRGSPLGIGTDYGGSIRVPATLTGLYGLRPSAGRVPYQGVANSNDGHSIVNSVIGPLSTSVGALRLMMKAVVSQQPWLHDPLVLELPWREEDYISDKKLCFGILRQDTEVRPHPAIIRAVDMVVAAMEALGHEVVEWKPLRHADMYKLRDEISACDGGQNIHADLRLSGEPPASRIPMVFGMEPTEPKNATQIAELHIRKREIQKEYMDYWNSTAEVTSTGRAVDAFISPLVPFTGMRPGFDEFTTNSAIVNMLDYPACAFPVTVADKAVDVLDAEYKPQSENDAYNVAMYDAELYHGAPVGLQLVGRRLQEEKVLALTELVVDGLAKLGR